MTEPLLPCPFRKKPIAVSARQLVEAELVSTAHGRVRAEAGDWVLTDPTTGDTWPIKPDIFAATYERADAPSPAKAKLLEVAEEMAKKLGSFEDAVRCGCCNQHGRWANEWAATLREIAEGL